MHREEGLSFKNVVTFNLDEYFPMKPDAHQSYVRFMHEYLFDHIDIDLPISTYPTVTWPLKKVEQFCSDYEKKSKRVWRT